MNIEKTDKIIKKQHCLLLILFICTFFYTDIIKEIIIQNLGINVKLSPVLMILTLYCVFKYGKNILLWWLYTLIIAIVLLAAYSNNLGFSTILRTISTILVPLTIVSIKIYKPKELITKFIRIFNYIITVYVLMGIVDYITNGFFIRILNILLKNSYYNNSIGYDLSIGVFRWFSLLGHPLTNTMYMLIFLGLNISYMNVYKKPCGNIYIVYLIAFIGSFLSNSKFGIIIIAIMLVINIINQKNKLTYIILLCLGVIVIVNTSYFEENVLARFKAAMASGDITNGRLTVLNNLLNYNLYKVNIFIGNGMSSSDIIVKSIFSSTSGLTNMEIPILMFLYEYGFLTTCLMYIAIILYPFGKLIINKKIFISVILILIFMFINSFNGIATGTGLMQVYTVTIVLIINMIRKNS